MWMQSREKKPVLTIEWSLLSFASLLTAALTLHKCRHICLHLPSISSGCQNLVSGCGAWHFLCKHTHSIALCFPSFTPFYIYVKSSKICCWSCQSLSWKKKPKTQLVPILVVSCWVERTKRCHRSCCSNSNISPETLWELSELCKSVQAVLSPVSLSGRHLETWEMPVRFFDWEKTPKITFAAQEVWQDAVAGLCRLSDSISVACLPFTRNILIVTAQMFPQSPLWASGLFADKCSTKESKKKKKKKETKKKEKT